MQTVVTPLTPRMFDRERTCARNTASKAGVFVFTAEPERTRTKLFSDRMVEASK
jgi:hypothetical protein